MSDTKEHIINVSFGLFLSKSFKEVTMNELVKKTGMSKGAFYHYFESKEQLFQEVINKILSLANVDYSRFSNNSLHQFYNDYLNYFESTTSNVMKSIVSSEGSLGLNYFALIFDGVKIFPEFGKKMLDSYDAELDAWKQIVSTARKSGEIKSPMNDEQIANMFIYSNDGVGMRYILKGNSDLTLSSLKVLWNSFYEVLKA